jgi:hypothetical protein
MSKPRKLTDDEAAAVHWFLNHLSFEDYLASVPPHLPKDVRTDKAYEIRDALAAFQQHAPTVPSVGDWMYRRPAPAETT